MKVLKVAAIAAVVEVLKVAAVGASVAGVAAAVEEVVFVTAVKWIHHSITRAKDDTKVIWSNCKILLSSEGPLLIKL